MNLNVFTDYSLRVLLYLSLQPEKRVSIEEIAQFYHISRDHLVKVVHHLGKCGFIRTVRGRSGGIQLARQANSIKIGDVVRKTESNFHLVECFDSKSNQCRITPFCNLKDIFAEATQQFLHTLDQYTLDDLVHDRDSVKQLVSIDSQ